MALLILLFFLSLPLIEIMIFVAVGSEIGGLETVILTIVTAVVGITIARAQGFGVLAAMRKASDAGEPPVLEMVHGLFLLIAGVLLLIPGFLTDSVGALLLIPPMRSLLARFGLQNVIVRGQTGTASNSSTIDAEYWEETDEPGPGPRHLPGKSDG